MALTLPPNINALLHRETQTLCVATKIERRDGVIKRFNDSDITLTLWDGGVYASVGSPERSSTRYRVGMQGNSYALNGVIRPDAIDPGDVVRRLYNDAEITQWIVDWRYPFEGPMDEFFGYIQSIQYTDEVWKAEVLSVADKLNVERGRVHSATRCGHILGKNTGQSFCQADVALTNGQVTASSGVGKLYPRGRFRSNITTPGGADQFWRYGRLTWQTGNNAVIGIRDFDVFRSLNANGEIELFLETYNDIEIGDQFLVRQGCDHTKETCNQEFGRRVDIDLDIYNPGFDKWVKGPNK